MELELLTLNAFGSVRPATRGGRPFLVANGTIIVPGVLPGSKGPLFYPEDEVRNSAPLWDNVDIVLRHPTDPRTGAALSAKSAGVLQRVGMGLLQNTAFKSGRLGTELWFDVHNTERLDLTLHPDHRVLPKLRRGQPVELSTGLYTKQKPAPLGAVFNGRSYSAVAVAYRPDHLAVLPDEVGACSIRDGCGVLVNSRGEPTMTRLPDLFGTLTENCGGKGGKPGPCKGWKKGLATASHPFDKEADGFGMSKLTPYQRTVFRKRYEDAAKTEGENSAGFPLAWEAKSKVVSDALRTNGGATPLHGDPVPAEAPKRVRSAAKTGTKPTTNRLERIVLS